MWRKEDYIKKEKGELGYLNNKKSALLSDLLLKELNTPWN